MSKFCDYLLKWQSYILIPWLTVAYLTDSEIGHKEVGGMLFVSLMAGLALSAFEYAVRDAHQ